MQWERQKRLSTVRVGSRVAMGAMWLACSMGTAAQAETVPAVRPIGSSLEVKPHFSFDDKKTRRSVSGMACVPAGARQQCLVVFDEGTKAQFALLTPDRLEPIGSLVELTGTNGELDAEGAASAGGFYYVTGSHSVKRNSCASNPTSRQVIRLAALVPPGSSHAVAAAHIVGTTRLWDLMLADPYLRLRADGCLGDGSGGSTDQMQHRPGVNIEGLAVTGGRLYAGFRGPSEGGVAPVFSVDAKALFEGGDAKPRLDRLSLGNRVGIRDMAVTRSSILLLLGPDDHEAGAGATWKVAEWAPGTAAAPKFLAVLDVREEDIAHGCVEEIKPEALVVLEESALRYRVVVLSDGVCDGGPLVFDIPR